MDYSAIFVAFSLLWKLSSSVKCYRCNPAHDVFNPQIPLCEHFDASDKFIKDCPYSTVCVKTETSLKNLEDASRTVTRDCALQTRDDEQEKNEEGKWHYVRRIHEIYKEGCKDESSELGSTKTLSCYCRGDYCNTAHHMHFSQTFLSLIFSLWFILQ